MASVRVLLVDDEVDVLEALGRALRLGGLNVTMERNAEAALALCAEHPFDVIVVDFIMPTMSGIEFLSRARKTLPLVRTVIISGKLDDAVPEKDVIDNISTAVETDIFLHKPVPNDKLLEIIENLVGNKPDTWEEIARKAVEADGNTIKDARNATQKVKSLKPKT